MKVKVWTKENIEYFENFLWIPYPFDNPVEYLDYSPKVFNFVKYSWQAELLWLKASDMISIVCYTKNLWTFILPYKYKDNFLNFLKSWKIEDLPFNYKENSFKTWKITTFEIIWYLNNKEQIETLKIQYPKNYDLKNIDKYNEENEKWFEIIRK